MRQRQEHQVGIAKGVGTCGDEVSIGQLREIGVQRDDWLPRIRAGRNGSDVDFWMRQQQPQQLSAGIPRRTRNTDPDHE